MADFRLTDLASQADEVARLVSGRDTQEILDRLERFGEVRKVPNRYDDQLYVFHSISGAVTGFRLEEGGRLYILGDNTVYRPN